MNIISQKDRERLQCDHESIGRAAGNGKYCVVNNTYEPQSTTVYKGDGISFDLELEANEIIWYEI